MSARYIVGDALEVMATLEPGSVDLICTSPPFLALRSYLPADHPDKAREIGSEATPGEFLDVMLDVVEACARVLAPHGSLVFELGDTYAGSGGAGGDYNDGGLREGAPGFSGSARAARPPSREGYRGGPLRDKQTDFASGMIGTTSGERSKANPGSWPLDKSKVLVPQLFAIALAYGFNPLTGRQTEPWRVRNTVIWAKPNPPVGRDGDKFRPGHSTLTVACKARDRYWDGDAVRTPHQAPDTRGETPYPRVKPKGGARNGERIGSDVVGAPSSGANNPAGAPLLDWWNIPTEPYAGSHYATWPRKLVVPVIEAMAPRRVCRVCGKPSVRITEQTPEYAEHVGTRGFGMDERRSNDSHLPAALRSHGRGGPTAQYETLGWSDCGCKVGRVAIEPAGLSAVFSDDHWRNGMVLDPFAGSGTTLQVATGHGRDAIGIDLDARNAELAVERIGGLFLEIEYFAKGGVA